MSVSLRLRLSLLMFLQYAILGLWAVTLPTFLKSPPNEGGLALPARDVGLLYGTLALGATIAPLFVGLLADRLFATQRLLALLHFVGAGLLIAAASTCEKHRTEVGFVFDQLAMSKTVADAELWRFLWEKESIQHYLADSDGYGKTPPPLPPHIQRLLNWLGISRQRFASVEFRAIPTTPDAARQRLTELDRVIRPALVQVLADPKLSAVARKTVAPLFAILLAYACCYVATITLANALTFRNLPDPAHQFGQVRALGTVGWIGAGVFVGVFLPTVSSLPIIAAALASFGMAVFALFLPHTPPSGKSRTLADALGVPALKMLADRSFLVFVLTALASSFLMAFHNVFTNPFLVDLGVPVPAAAQTLGQYTEVAGILLIPIVRGWIGMKRLLLVGLLASGGRFLGYASQSWTGVLAIGLPLHGIGFSFFYITAAIYVDQQAPPDLRASAQGLVTLITVGAGALLGNWFSGRIVDWNTSAGTVDWRHVWLVPAVGTLIAACGFALLFREPVRQPPVADEIVPDVELPGA
jgi:nucleoside transporter